MTYRLAAGVERVETRGGPALLARTPLRLVKLNAPLARLLSKEGDLLPRSAAEARAFEALHERGLLVCQRGPGLSADQLPSVSVIIPVRDRAEELRRCLESLARVRYPSERLEILVVDDGSEDGTADVARSFGVCVIPSGGRARGPAAARNRGAAVARGEILAFIDSDCTASEGWLVELAEVLEDREVVAVGGRVEGLRTSSALDRYEAEMSSLCLGKRSRSGQRGKDTFYLPSCNLLVRRREFVASGGFREVLRVGEDVDLTWRLRDRGGKIVYLPFGKVLHEHRHRLGAFLRQRFQYGTSEALLDVLHPERRKKILLPWALTLSAILGALSWLTRSWWSAAMAAAVVLLDAAGQWGLLRREAVRISPGSVLWARIRVWGSLVYYIASHLTRYYAPALILLGMAWPRFGLLGAALACYAGAADYAVKRPALHFPAFLGLYLAEQQAYGAGVFWGCLRQGSFRSYRLVLGAKG